MSVFSKICRSLCTQKLDAKNPVIYENRTFTAPGGACGQIYIDALDRKAQKFWQYEWRNLSHFAPRLVRLKRGVPYTIKLVLRMIDAVIEQNIASDMPAAKLTRFELE